VEARAGVGEVRGFAPAIMAAAPRPARLRLRKLAISAIHSSSLPSVL